MSDMETLWGHEEDLDLSAKSPEEYADYVVDRILSSHSGEKAEERLRDEEIIAHEYKRMPVHVRPGTVLDTFLDYLDEEYGNPEGGGADAPTEAMREAESRFVASVLAEFENYHCEPTGKKARVGLLDRYLKRQAACEAGKRGPK